jgi:hypothetical protein
MLHAVQFHDGHADYRNRFVRTVVAFPRRRDSCRERYDHSSRRSRAEGLCSRAPAVVIVEQ